MASLSSLQYVRPNFLSLNQPHPLFASLNGNAFESRAATVQALLLCGRYRTEKLRHHWSENKHGICQIQQYYDLKLVETQQHFLLCCPGLSDERRRLYEIISLYANDKPVLKSLLTEYFYIDDNDLKMQFLLDPSVMPKTISAVQQFGEVVHQECFKISRLWCRSLHVARSKKLCRNMKR